MKIEIWSDVACPFCYIGQAYLSQAFAQFDHRDEVVVEWKSFILDPSLPMSTDQNLYTSLSERKGMPMQQVMQMTERVADMAAQAGLKVDFDKAKPVNTAKAHQLLQFAKTKGLGHETKLRLFEAYFAEGANIADNEVLLKLATEVGLPAVEAKEALQSGRFEQAVEQDVYQSRTLAVSGVPYILVDGKYNISGAQPPASMLRVLEQAFAARLSSTAPPKEAGR